MPKLVTVHGTGAGDLVDAGKSWWQLQSPFQAELARRLDLASARVEIVPFHWALGPNSENERRAAGRALFAANPEFVDLAAFGLERAGLAPFNDNFWHRARREQVQVWYQALAPAAAPSLGSPLPHAAKSGLDAGGAASV